MRRYSAARGDERIPLIRLRTFQRRSVCDGGENDAITADTSRGPKLAYSSQSSSGVRHARSRPGKSRYDVTTPASGKDTGEGLSALALR